MERDTLNVDDDFLLTPPSPPPIINSLLRQLMQKLSSIKLIEPTFIAVAYILFYSLHNFTIYICQENVTRLPHT